jgi:hypothetical protein
MTNEAFRGRGQLFVCCSHCSSKGTTRAQTTFIDKQEWLANCPWCDTQLNIQVQPLPEGLAHPDWS